MFVELMPLIENRSVTLTVSKLKGTDGRIRVNFVPKELIWKKPNLAYGDESGVKLEKAAESLNLAFSITGTPAEIDAELAVALTDYASGIQALSSNLDEVRTSLEEAHKLAEDAKKAKKTEPKKAEHPAKNAEVKVGDGHKRSTTGAAKAPDKFTLFDTATEANASVAASEPDGEVHHVEAAEIIDGEAPSDTLEDFLTDENPGDGIAPSEEEFENANHEEGNF